MDYPEILRLKENLIFDSHAHLDSKRFDDFREELIENMFQNGVGGIVTCGCDVESSKKALSIAENHEFIYAAVGYHPCDVDEEVQLDVIEELAHNKKCVAIGEIGLDYYWEKENAEQQKVVFEELLSLAKRLALPVIVHDREAHADTLEILKKHKPKGILHCYSGSVEMAEEIIKLGMYIGVGGVITFKNARKLPDVVRAIPDDKLLLETDCPYLAPEPFRGKLCHSGMITLTAEKIAEIRNTSRDEILKISFENAKKIFGI